MSAPVQRVAAHIRGRFARHADLQQHPAFEGHVTDGVIAVVGAPQRVIRRDMDAVRAGEQALAPGSQEIAGAIEDDHRMLAAAEDIDVVAAIDTDRGDLAIGPSGGKRAPVLDHFVAVRSILQHFRWCHDVFLPTGVSYGTTPKRTPGGRTIAPRLDPCFKPRLPCRRRRHRPRLCPRSIPERGPNQAMG
jgi:hypothetical protein